MESIRLSELPDNPRESANFLSNLFFCYTMPTFLKGREKDLKPSDLYRALNEDKASKLAGKMSKVWEDEVQQKTKEGKEPKLARVALKVFRLIILKQAIFMFCLEFFLKVTQPIFIGYLVSYYSHPGGKIKDAWLYAGGVILCSALNVALNHSFMLGQVHCGMKLRIATMGMIYRKSLRLNKTALGDTTTGKIVNLITNDVGKMDFALIGFNALWVGPLETILIVYLIYREIGVSSIAGVIFLLLFIPIQGILGKKIAMFRTQTATRTDERVRLMNEIIQGIQIIKMNYAFIYDIHNAILHLHKFDRVCSPGTARHRRESVCSDCLLRYPATNNDRHVSARHCPIGRNACLAQAYPKFYALSGDANTDSEEDTVVDLKLFARHHRKRDSIDQGIDKGYLKLTNVKAKWKSDSPEYTLDGISFEANPGQLIAIVGPVGSGKSSVIQAILGEMQIESGSVEANGVLSYAPQDPWVFSGTIRQNILFGYPMEKRRYRLAIRQCALEIDFQQFPFRDRTIVGDRGQSLSGGQKARISLARAIYRRGSIYLLDDPLSAVDSHVARHLFEQCMRKYLRKHIVILVTNQLQFLEQADKIIVMKEGKIETMGTYSQLKDSGVDFTNLLSEKEDKNEKEEDDLVDLVATAALLREAYNRQSSIVSITSMEETEAAPDTRLLMQEVQQYGSIGLATYKRYLQAGGGPFIFIIMFFFCVAAQLFASGCDYFLAYWVDREASLELHQNQTLEIHSTMDFIVTNDTLPTEIQPRERDSIDIAIFTALILGTIIVSLSRSILVFKVAMRASKNLHDAMYRGISQATMFFFNTNPAGRILNRFSKDMGQVDEVLPSILIDMIQVFFTLIGILVVISVVNVWFLIPAAFIVIIFYFLRGFYLKTSRNVTRMEAVSRSPVYSHLSASLNGLSTIRAFDAQTVLIHEFDDLQDAHSSVFYTMISISRAFGLWLDSICLIYIALVTLSFFVFGGENPGNVGLAITQAIGMTGMVQWGMRQSAELENIMTAVERVTEYEKIENENRLEKAIEKKPPKEWPEKGHIRFENLSLKYVPHETEHVLKNLTFEIYPQEKVGIVGRTGAGKSSLINAVFRLSFNDGDILIDSRNIREMSLRDLRSKISIIPQVPVLFSGSVRYNLDPFEEYSDAKLWEVLEEVQLKSVVAELPDGLHTKVTEGGANFSVGQRQLICLARTILRENKILIMDEATANVDPQTDALILSTIRNKFKDCTVVTIAHRLNTVMHSDRVIVMDSGRIIESGVPYLLLTETNSKILRHMAQEAGKTMFSNLLKIAKESYEANKKEA
ncbi:unnamed protein product [Hermetia illucens]|uniref:Multidrug resistance-associated protein lethal(2)03659 n=1 Tax=Hermetia illucens TaxID=343691 RepID=A0A7R8V6G2_HERIL|nr:unnamed protein product [Hermetia illucens]